MAPLADNPVKICTVETSEGTIMVPYLIKRSRRSRYIRLSLSGKSYATLTVPQRAKDEEAVSFLKEQGDWLKKHFNRIKKLLTLFEYLEKRPFVSAFGKRIPLNFAFTKAEPELVFEEDAERVTLKINSEQPVEPQMVAMLKSMAKKVVRQRAIELAAKAEVRVKRVTVRDQLRCWGSCSDRRTVSLNWRLLLLPPELQDYIIYHEMAHLTHLDHSEDFWGLLQEYDRNAVSHDIRISRISQEIMTLGRC